MTDSLPDSKSAYISHYGLRTKRRKEMIQWYQTVFGAKIQHENDFLAFMTFDEEHHRLKDGTVLHVSIWIHRFGGQVAPDFFIKPETAGWTQLLIAPLNPLVSSKK